MGKFIKINDYAIWAKKIRTLITSLSKQSKTGHVGPSLSCVEILLAIDSQINRGDKFILSKGHAVMAHYALLVQKGLIDKNELIEKYCQNGSNYLAHPSHRHLPSFIDWSTGSLGHGLSISCGMAYSFKTDGNKKFIYVLLSDGECNEGSTWEAALFAGHHKLKNILAFIDYNKLQALGRTQDILTLHPILEKWSSFGWQVEEIDGHDAPKIINVIKKIKSSDNPNPKMIICHTIKGKGLKNHEDRVSSHYVPQSNEDLYD